MIDDHKVVNLFEKPPIRFENIGPVTKLRNVYCFRCGEEPVITFTAEIQASLTEALNELMPEGIAHLGQVDIEKTAIAVVSCLAHEDDLITLYSMLCEGEALTSKLLSETLNK